MSQETRVSNPDDLQNVVREFEEEMMRFIVFLAWCMGVLNEAEDLVQDFWVRVVRRWNRIKEAESLISMLKKIAVNTVISFAGREKVRVHICFVLDADIDDFFEAHDLKDKFELLEKTGPTGLPIYSGKVWRSSVNELNDHPDVAYLAVRGCRGLDTIHGMEVADPSWSAGRIEVQAELNRCFDLVLPMLTESQAEVLMLCEHEGLSEAEVGSRLGLKTSVVHRYRMRAWAVLRRKCPWLRDYIQGS